MPSPPPERNGFTSHPLRVPGAGRVRRTRGPGKPASPTTRARRRGSRARARTEGGFPHIMRLVARALTALGWFSKLASYTTASQDRSRAAAAAARALNRPSTLTTCTSVAQARRSRSPNPSTATTSYPARTADSAMSRVDTPASSTRVMTTPTGAVRARAARHTGGPIRCPRPHGSPAARPARDSRPRRARRRERLEPLADGLRQGLDARQSAGEDEFPGRGDGDRERHRRLDGALD